MNYKEQAGFHPGYKVTGNSRPILKDKIGEIIMISNPKNGWCNFKLGSFSGTPSYITDVPKDLLECFINCFSKNAGCCYFDEEGSSFVLVLTDTNAYIISEKEKTELINIKDFNISKMAMELINDIVSDIDAWVDFSYYEYDRDEKEYYKKELLSMIDGLKKQLRYHGMELGNLIFGNSRGQYPVNREDFQNIFVEFLNSINCSEYGYMIDSNSKYKNERGGIKTPVFEINPYYWGEDDNEAIKPNFIYYPSNLKIKWYKYPLRDSYSNKEFTKNEFIKILTECQNSIR